MDKILKTSEDCLKQKWIINAFSEEEMKKIDADIRKAKYLKDIIKILKKNNFTEFQIGYYVGMIMFVSNSIHKFANTMRTFEKSMKKIMKEEPRYIG